MKNLPQNTDVNFCNKVVDLLKEARKSIVQSVKIVQIKSTIFRHLNISD